MEVGNTRELLSKLDAGELDFAVVEGEFPREEYEFLLYRKEPYVPVASRKKAEQYRNAEFRELLSERLILREPGSGTREILERELRRRGMTTDDFSQITELGISGQSSDAARQSGHFLFLPGNADRPRDAAGAD